MRRQNQACAGVEEETEELERPDAPPQNVFIPNINIALNVNIIKSETKSEQSNKVSSGQD